MATKYVGFKSYLETGTFTPEFIHDYEYWCKRIYWAWKGLQTDFESFYEICWEALLSKIKEFDSSIATIQTFCISRINNEAWRMYMKNKNRKPEIDCDNEVIKNTLTFSEREDDVIHDIDDFILYCNSVGVSVNRNEMIKSYYDNSENPAMLAFTWWKATNDELKGVDDGFSKRRRRTAS